MKEATGELNMTVVTIVAIAALLAFFYAVIWPNLKAGMALSSACNAANGVSYSVTNDDGSTIACNGATNGCRAENGQCCYRTAGNTPRTQTRACADNR